MTAGVARGPWTRRQGRGPTRTRRTCMVLTLLLCCTFLALNISFARCFLLLLLLDG